MSNKVTKKITVTFDHTSSKFSTSLGVDQKRIGEILHEIADFSKAAEEFNKNKSKSVRHSHGFQWLLEKYDGGELLVAMYFMSFGQAVSKHITSIAQVAVQEITKGIEERTGVKGKTVIMGSDGEEEAEVMVALMEDLVSRFTEWVEDESTAEDRQEPDPKLITKLREKQKTVN